MARHVLVIPKWHPARINQWEGRHWTVKARLKKSDQEIVWTYSRLAGLPTAEGKRRVRLTIVLGPRQRGGDPDAYWKSLLDALVCAGQLVDDSRQWVTTCPVKYERSAERATRIELEDLPCPNEDATCRSRKSAMTSEPSSAASRRPRRQTRKR